MAGMIIMGRRVVFVSVGSGDARVLLIMYTLNAATAAAAVDARGLEICGDGMERRWVDKQLSMEIKQSRLMTSQGDLYPRKTPEPRLEAPADLRT